MECLIKYRLSVNIGSIIGYSSRVLSNTGSWVSLVLMIYLDFVKIKAIIKQIEKN